MNDFLDWASSLDLPRAVFWLAVANVAAFALALLAGWLAALALDRRRIVARPDPLTRREVVYTAAGVVINTLVTVAAWWLWVAGVLVIRREAGWRVLPDFLALLLLMDLGMYLLHRLAHAPAFFAVHRLHHEYERVRPLTLFVVHPLETLGFGLLWLGVVVLYGPTWLGLCLYMGANLAAGTLGHLGVEPFPRWWARAPVLREVGTSTFHAQHHSDRDHNFGFYTLLWDRLFGTLSPAYEREFGRKLESAGD